jgi:hypothetical protein
MLQATASSSATIAGGRAGRATPSSLPSKDDHTRLVYAELHSAENATNVSLTLTRGARWFREQGCGAPEAVMSDNAFAYTKGPKFAAALGALGARHIRILPYAPRWNGPTAAPGPTAPPATAPWSGPGSSDTLGLAPLAVLVVDLGRGHGLELGG